MTTVTTVDDAVGVGQVDRVAADQIERAQFPDRLAATVEHRQHHLVAAFGGRGEREPEPAEQRRLQDAETVIAPTGLGVVIRDTVAQQRLVIAADQVVARCPRAPRAPGWSQ